MKFKHLLFIPLISLFGLTSCNNNKDPYKDKLEKDSDKLVLDGDIKTTYNTGDNISIGSLKVTYNSEPITYFDSDESEIPDKQYFITTSNEAPTTYRIKKSDKLNTSKEKYVAKVYVAMIDKSVDKVFISHAKEITVTNSNALNPILYYVGGAVIIVAVAAMVYFTKRYKETHPSK